MSMIKILTGSAKIYTEINKELTVQPTKPCDQATNVHVEVVSSLTTRWYGHRIIPKRAVVSGLYESTPPSWSVGYLIQQAQPMLDAEGRTRSPWLKAIRLLPELDHDDASVSLWARDPVTLVVGASVASGFEVTPDRVVGSGRNRQLQLRTRLFTMGLSIAPEVGHEQILPCLLVTCTVFH